MLLVLIVHADYYSLDSPTPEFARAAPLSAFMRVATESFALVCVNVFILISGYFGIRLRIKSVFKLLFMILFWRILLSAVMYSIQVVPVEPEQALKACIPGYHDWFVTHYLLLMAVAPLLNKLIERSSTRRLLTYAVLYTLFQWVFSWGTNLIPWFSKGYSVLSFVGLYVAGACARRLQPTINDKFRHPATCYATITLTAATVMFAIIYYSVPLPRAEKMFCAYNGVNVMLASVALFLVFGRRHFVSKRINWLAGSAFAVYLLHMHPLVKHHYHDICLYLYDNYAVVPYLLLISIFIATVFTVAIVVDQLRRFLWQKLCRYPRLFSATGWIHS